MPPTSRKADSDRRNGKFSNLEVAHDTDLVHAFMNEYLAKIQSLQRISNARSFWVDCTNSNDFESIYVTVFAGDAQKQFVFYSFFSKSENDQNIKRLEEYVQTL